MDFYVPLFHSQVNKNSWWLVYMVHLLVFIQQALFRCNINTERARTCQLFFQQLGRHYPYILHRGSVQEFLRKSVSELQATDIVDILGTGTSIYKIYTLQVSTE